MRKFGTFLLCRRFRNHFRAWPCVCCRGILGIMDWEANPNYNQNEYLYQQIEIFIMKLQQALMASGTIKHGLYRLFNFYTCDYGKKLESHEIEEMLLFYVEYQ